MKKLLSYVLALTLLVSTMGVTFAAPADVTDASEIQAVDVLMALGVVNGYQDGTYRPQNIVTRAEMLKLIVVALGYEGLAASSNNSFTDANNHWAKGYIGVGVNLGIVEGYGDGTFGPDNPVKYSEAATMLVRALGWTNQAIGGVWPTNYVAKATSLGIFDGVNYVDAGATRGDIAEMVFNTLSLGIGTVDQNGQYQLNPSDTMLTRLGGQLLNTTPAVYQGTLPTVANLRKQIGELSHVYTNAAGNEVIAVINKATTLVGTVNAAQTKFTVGNNEYTLPTFPTTAYETYLNADQTSTTATAALTANADYMLSVDLNGMTITKIHAASQWAVTQSQVVTSADLANMASNKTLFTVNFKLDGNGDIDTNSFELIGANSLADIDDGDVVYLYDDGTYITKVVVGKTVINNAKITVRTATEVTINGTEYEAADPTYNNVITDLFTNNIYLPANENDFDFRLDYFGKIFAVTPVATTTPTENYAVLLTSQDKGSVFSSNPEAKAHLFLADGTDAVFEVVAANSALLNAAGVWLPAATGNYGALVKYTTNSNGQISSFEMPTTTSFAVATPTNINGALITDGTNSATIVPATKVFTYNGSGVSDPANYGTMTVANFKATPTLGGEVLLDSGNAAAVLKTNVSTSVVHAVTTGLETAVVGGFQNNAYTDGSLVNYISNASQGLTTFTLYTITLSNGNATFGAPVAITNETPNFASTTIGAVTLIGNTIKADAGSNVYNYLVLENDVEIYAQSTDGTVSVLTPTELANKLNADEVATIVTYDEPTADGEMDFVLVTLN